MFLIYYILFFSEIFHSIGHSLVLLRIYRPSDHWLKSHIVYFVWDALSAFLTYTYYLHKVLPIYYELIHIILHIYFVLTWNKSKYSIQIREWSSKEYIGPYISINLLLTIYDVFIHSLYSYYLYFV